ncbi:MAG: PilZ domain-containing protein [Deltaproteobacteria bacterium]|nr:PilZ domain-containing protein [Deltaproteobacteria bacterium]
MPLRNRAVFREQSFENNQGGLFVPGDVDVALGEEVVLEISFLEEQVRFRIRASVKWKRAAAGRRALPGVGLAFLPSEQSTRDQLESFVNGDHVDHVERDTRRYSLHLEIKVDAGALGQSVRRTDDLSLGGCFLLWDDPPPIGTVVKLKLTAPGAFFSWITLPATVCWHRTDVVDDGNSVRRETGGCGLQFMFNRDADRRRTEKLLAVLKERFVREVRVLAPKATLPPQSMPPPTSKPPTPSMLPRK